MNAVNMKAFAVTEHCENTGGIFFAEHNIVARRLGANEYADGELSYVSCRRAPWADSYFGKRVPARLMIAHGWHFECSDCGARIDEDYLREKKLPVDGVIGTQDSHVFCGSNCARHWYSIEARRKNEERRAIDAFKAIVSKRFPNPDFCDDEQSSFKGHHAYVEPAWRTGWVWRQVVVTFRFPGMKIAPASFRVNGYGQGLLPPKAYYTCASGDREVFEAYAKATRR